jgi:hypothetical protein
MDNMQLEDINNFNKLNHNSKVTEQYLSRVPNLEQPSYSESTLDSNSEESNLNLPVDSDAEDIIADNTLHHYDNNHDTEDSGIEILNSPKLRKKRRRTAIERLKHELSIGGLRF